MHKIHRHVPAHQPQPASTNHAPSKATHPDHPAGVGVNGRGSQPPAGMYPKGSFGPGMQSIKPTARKDSTLARRRNGNYSDLVEHGEEEPAGFSMSGMSLAFGESDHGGQDSGGDGRGKRSASFAPPRESPNLDKRLAAGVALADTAWAHEALATGGDAGLMDAFADRLLQTPVREQGSGLGPAGHSHVHFTMLTMLKVLDGRAVERETVDAALNRLAAKPPAGPGQPRPPQWLAGQITPLFLAMTRRRPGERQQAAVASRKTACRASL